MRKYAILGASILLVAAIGAFLLPRLSTPSVPEDALDQVFFNGYSFDLIQVFSADEFLEHENREDFSVAGSIELQLPDLETAMVHTGQFASTHLPVGTELYAGAADDAPGPQLVDGQESRYLVFEDDGSVREYRVGERYLGEHAHEGYSYALVETREQRDRLVQIA